MSFTQELEQPPQNSHMAIETTAPNQPSKATFRLRALHTQYKPNDIF